MSLQDKIDAILIKETASQLGTWLCTGWLLPCVTLRLDESLGPDDLSLISTLVVNHCMTFFTGHSRGAKGISF